MIRINLLPHRELRRERRKKEFVGMALASVAAAGLTAFAVGVGINRTIDAQAERNALLAAENAKLDERIKQIATLRTEIEGLHARQQAVENLQADRTMPVHLLDELVKYTPDGLHLKQVQQEGLKVTLAGHAQSNERVSELLRNLAYNTPWLERPELGEIKLVMLPVPGAPAAREGRRAYEFTLNAMLRRPGQPAEPERAVRTAEAGAVGAIASAASATTAK